MTHAEAWILVVAVLFGILLGVGLSWLTLNGGIIAEWLLASS